MNVNIGTTERVFRVVVGLAIIGVALFYQSWWGLVGLEIGLTGIVGWSPLYRLFDISTAGHETRRIPHGTAI